MALFPSQTGEGNASIKARISPATKKAESWSFRYLNQEYLSRFYQEDTPITWNGYLLAAIDTSKAEVPNSEENRRAFGQSNNQHTQSGQVRAFVSGAYDVLNHFYLDLQLGAISCSESEMAKRHFHNLLKVVGDSSVLLIFDKGYPSIEFIGYLQEPGMDHAIHWYMHQQAE